jgi:poly(3-hydroxybutyrate) depolymerase
MLYTLYEAGYAAAQPWRLAALAARDFWGSPLNPMRETELARGVCAASQLFANLTRRYERPTWGLEVEPQAVWATPWVRLLHFAKGGGAEARPAPKALIVAPLSGHYATLLRGTVRTFLRDHDVYVTEWSNARDVPLSAGDFDLADYVDALREMLRTLGGRAHVVAVCQPGPAALAAASLMAEDGEPSRPASLTLMGSPIDARRSPTVTNRLAETRPLAWFEANMIHTVPASHPGAGRRVYPGFLQLSAFMSMNLERHQAAHWRYLEHLMQGDGDSAARHLEFYDEYLSVLDLPEAFYLQTVDQVFQRHLLAAGRFTHRGRPVRPQAISDIGLLTVEGENDDISGVGQTQAAHALCTGLPADLKEDHVQPQVGHYGVFNGQRFEDEIYPRVREFIRRMEPGFDTTRA